MKFFILKKMSNKVVQNLMLSRNIQNILRIGARGPHSDHNAKPNRKKSEKISFYSKLLSPYLGPYEGYTNKFWLKIISSYTSLTIKKKLEKFKGGKGSKIYW